MIKVRPSETGSFQRFDSIKTLALISDTHGLLRDSVIEALREYGLASSYTLATLAPEACWNAWKRSHQWSPFVETSIVNSPVCRRPN